QPLVLQLCRKPPCAYRCLGDKPRLAGGGRRERKAAHYAQGKSFQNAHFYSMQKNNSALNRIERLASGYFRLIFEGVTTSEAQTV
ncbi:MAG: hypothetical protein NXH84_18295, partial [Rhodobacteraceae bacterium]|nr:hypothetical protein [Paracoccaceae bacterium]